MQKFREVIGAERLGRDLPDLRGGANGELIPNCSSNSPQKARFSTLGDL